MTSKTSGPQRVEFKADLKQVLDIITHSLYSHREVFLRELISNACDAVDKLRFEALTDESLLEGDADWKVRLSADTDAGTLTISDNGIGMDESTIVDDLGTIARSGTRAFLDRLKEVDDSDRPELIGQFGVGFYSAFMVADTVTVISRRAKGAQGVRWVSDGQGEFTIEPAERDGHGTDVILHLRDDAKEFLEEFRLRGLVKKYSDFVEHPVVMQISKEEDGETSLVDETLNSQKAIWLRTPAELSEEDYASFYKQISHDFNDPLETVHYAAEGTIEFKALLFLPRQRPWDLMWGDAKSGLNLYIQRVFIMDDCADLLPEYLRFVRGVVDAADLPLNVSREMLQDNAMVDRIRKNLVKKLLRSFAEMKEKREEDYGQFFGEFGAVLKEGVSRDFENKDEIAKLLLFTVAGGQDDAPISLADYVDGMPPEQEAIYYLIGEDRERLAHSPYLESVADKGFKVLLLTDPIDEFVVQALPSFEDKPLKALDRGELESSSVDEEKSGEQQAEFGALFETLADRIDEVKEVRLSRRLTTSAACLVVEDGAASAHMERLMGKLGRDGELPTSQRILELNPEHPAVEALRRIFEADRSDARVEDYGRLFYDQAVLAEGSSLKDPSSFAARVNRLIAAEEPSGD